jgi:hypothetical protein
VYLENRRRRELKDKLYHEKEEKNRILQKNKIKNIKKKFVQRIDMFRSNKQLVKKVIKEEERNETEEEDKKYFME